TSEACSDRGSPSPGARAGPRLALGSGFPSGWRLGGKAETSWAGPARPAGVGAVVAARGPVSAGDSSYARTIKAAEEKRSELGRWSAAERQNAQPAARNRRTCPGAETAASAVMATETAAETAAE